ncbi:MAG: DNA topoisomerase VI subunit B, partial [Candidatus Woesearchaeota archaeon]
MPKEKEIDYAEVAAESQKQISVAEFFEKNRHLLGFDNPTRALLTAVKEAVDNSLDACEDANILPEIYIEMIEMDDSRYRVIVEDNGPGIVKRQVSSIFGKLLYGSKFHKMKQSRGQQGIGISAAILYSQLTTGKDAKIISKTKSKDNALKLSLHIDTRTNKPVISSEREVEWDREHGTSIELELEANYRKGRQSVDEYLKEVAIVNPHATITYVNPYAEQMIYTRAVKEVPDKPKEIKPHPHGIEFGKLIGMLQTTKNQTLNSFLINEFSRVGKNTSESIINESGLKSDFKPKKLKRVEMDRLYKAMKKVDVSTPRTDCLSPIGEEKILKGIKKETECEFYHTVTRSPTVYRGNPFLVEVGIAYGGDLTGDDSVNL